PGGSGGFFLARRHVTTTGFDCRPGLRIAGREIGFERRPGPIANDGLSQRDISAGANSETDDVRLQKLVGEERLQRHLDLIPAAGEAAVGCEREAFKWFSFRFIPDGGARLSQQGLLARFRSHGGGLLSQRRYRCNEGEGES